MELIQGTRKSSAEKGTAIGAVRSVEIGVCLVKTKGNIHMNTQKQIVMAALTALIFAGSMQAVVETMPLKRDKASVAAKPSSKPAAKSSTSTSVRKAPVAPTAVAPSVAAATAAPVAASGTATTVDLAQLVKDAAQLAKVEEAAREAAGELAAKMAREEGALANARSIVGLESTTPVTPASTGWKAWFGDKANSVAHGTVNFLSYLKDGFVSGCKSVGNGCVNGVSSAYNACSVENIKAHPYKTAGIVVGTLATTYGLYKLYKWNKARRAAKARAQNRIPTGSTLKEMIDELKGKELLPSQSNPGYCEAVFQEELTENLGSLTNAITTIKNSSGKVVLSLANPTSCVRTNGVWSCFKGKGKAVELKADGQVICHCSSKQILANTPRSWLLTRNLSLTTGSSVTTKQ